jgi:hypothetical protein
MSWKDLLDSNNATERTLPWFGFKRVHDAERSWTLVGPLPPEHGWFKFNAGGGREATLASPELQQIDPAWGTGQKQFKGYIVGDRFIRDDTWVDPDPNGLIFATVPTYCVEPGLERFARATVVKDREGHLVYMGQEFPIGPEVEVTRAFQDRAEGINKIAGATPALDLAFRFLTHDRLTREKHREAMRKLREAEAKKRAEQERIEKLMKDAGTAVGRRALAVHDFDTAAREALRVSGAELLDTRPSRNKNEMVVQYRFEKQRFECVVEKKTLRVVDAGVCLTDHATGQKGDTFFTLESLPGVIGEAMRRRKLVVWRHVDPDAEGDEEHEEIDWY